MAYIILDGYNTLGAIEIKDGTTGSASTRVYPPGTTSMSWSWENALITDTTLNPVVFDMTQFVHGENHLLTLKNGIELVCQSSVDHPTWYQSGTYQLQFKAGTSYVDVYRGGALSRAVALAIFGVIWTPAHTQCYAGLAAGWCGYIDGYSREFGTAKNVLLGKIAALKDSVPVGNNELYVDTDLDSQSRIYLLSQFAKSYYDEESSNVVADPYEAIMEMYGGGPSGPGGGQPSGNQNNENVPIPETPTIGAMSSGLVGVYVPTSQQLADLADWLWHSLDIDLLKKMFSHPMDAIIGLQIIPSTASHPTSTPDTLVYANFTTSVTMRKATEQYYELDCGTIQVPERYGAYLDWSPYTRISMYLPYIGTVPLDTDDVMGGRVRVVYKVDIVSGTVVCFVYCTGKNDQTSHVLYTYTGSCACNIPLSSGQYSNILTASLQMASGIAGAALAVETGGASVAAGVAAGTGQAVSGLNNMSKLDVRRSGSFGGSAGLMGIQKPYLIMTIPKLVAPANQNVYKGYPSFMTVSLGSLSGYNEIEVNHLSGMTCTDTEASEIIGLLRNGVIF